ncbi:MAG: Fic family protein [Sphingobacteriia bacterium]|nr:MAG: Fic family protein [Sphingobacteriia bacterium]
MLKTSIIHFIQNNPNCSSKEVFNGIGINVGYATVKRTISQLLQENSIIKNGNGKSTKYTISPSYQIFAPIDPVEYFKNEIDARVIQSSFNQELISNLLANSELFTQKELTHLYHLQATFKKNISTLSKQEYKNEFEKLAIDLSWKSSQIEGNTYSLLETERLLIDQVTADGKTKDEATMLLNHKVALDFILENRNYIEPLSVSGIEDIHSMLIKELNIGRNIRQRRVSITGTNYRPLDNEFQLKEALEQMCNLINSKPNIFEKAFLALILISYIQPFADGNKRTGRIICNALLMYNEYCPISFRTVNAIDYKQSLLVFYEQNNISAFKKIFIEQFEFAVKTYF